MPISPAHAAQQLKISRRTIMRAIESHEIKAFRDNKNHWKISEDELSRWAAVKRAHTEHAHGETPTSPTQTEIDQPASLQVQLVEAQAQVRALEALLQREREAVTDLKYERDQWRRQAEALAEKKAKWWPW